MGVWVHIPKDYKVPKRECKGQNGIKILTLNQKYGNSSVKFK